MIKNYATQKLYTHPVLSHRVIHPRSNQPHFPILQERAKLILKGNDLLNMRMPFASIDYKGQKSTIAGSRDTRLVSLSFIYRFGGYKEKEKKEVDTSRFSGL